MKPISRTKPIFRPWKPKSTDVQTHEQPQPKTTRQNQLSQAHIAKIIDTYQHRKEEPRYSRRVEMAEISKNDCNLNISRYISTATAEAEIELQAVHAELVSLDQAIAEARDKHNAFLKELGLPLLP